MFIDFLYPVGTKWESVIKSLGLSTELISFIITSLPFILIELPLFSDTFLVSFTSGYLFLLKTVYLCSRILSNKLILSSWLKLTESSEILFFFICPWKLFSNSWLISLYWASILLFFYLLSFMSFYWLEFKRDSLLRV